MISMLSGIGITTGLAAAFRCPIAAIVYAMEDLSTIVDSILLTFWVLSQFELKTVFKC